MTTYKEPTIQEQLKVYFKFKFSAKRASKLVGCCHQTACKYYSIMEAEGEKPLEDAVIIGIMKKLNF